MADSSNNQQFLGKNRFGGTPAPRVFIDEGQPGGREIPGGLGLLSNAPINRVPTTPHGPTIGAFSEKISPSVLSALKTGGTARAEYVKDVLARKR
jgi:hypothetical protein